MTGEKNLEVEIHNNKPHSNRKSKGRRVTMKDLEEEF